MIGKKTIDLASEIGEPALKKIQLRLSKDIHKNSELLLPYDFAIRKAIKMTHYFTQLIFFSTRLYNTESLKNVFFDDFKLDVI